MSDDEDPYAVSSDSDDERPKGPPPKVAIEGAKDLKQLREAIMAGDEKKQVKDEKTMEEIEELRRAKAEEMKRMKQEFESGKAGGKTAAEEAAEAQKESLEGVGKENLASMKEMFEKEPGKEFVSQGRDELLNELQQQSGDRKKLKNAFERTAEDEAEIKNCCICEKIVYPVEKIWAGKRLYHNQCFKCSKCGKKLSQACFNSHKGILYCKPHMMEALHPDRVGQFAADELEEGGQPMQVDDDDDEFAVSSKPRQLASDVVRAGGTSIGDELAQIKSLKEKKESWKSSVAADAQGGGAMDDEEKRRQLEEIKSQVSGVKQKWKTGNVEGATAAEIDAAKLEELEALKKSVNIKELFQPGAEGGEVQKSYDRSELDMAAIADARKSFVEGSAYQTGKAESAAASELSELKFTGMNAFKDKFEKGQGATEEIEKAKIELDLQLNDLRKNFEKPESEMSPEERAEKKKAEIEAEFARYKLARKMAKAQAEEGGDEEGAEGEKELDVQIKLAGKARDKFKQIEAQGGAGIPQPGSGSTKQPSKWDKKDAANGAEVVNKRVVADDSEGEEEEFDVKNLMNKFKQFAETGTGGAKKRGDMNLEELEALRMEAKNLREQFEKANQMESSEIGEEKRRQLEEEFKQLKGERERAKKELEEEQAEAAAAATGADKEDIQVAEAHASKMAAKWEKIHKKEAKKAEKSKMPQK